MGIQLCCQDFNVLQILLSGDDDPNVYRVEMSCGHTVDPISLTEWCRSRISQGHFKFYCPAIIDGINKGCGKEWSYMEVCRHALLSVEERQDFEEKLATLAASSYYEYKQCPRCGSNVGRKDEMNVSVTCSVCTAIDGIPFEFCWQCMKKWKGPAPRSDKCDNEGCINEQLKCLKNCDTKTLPDSNVQNCPILRACPTCGLLIKHKAMCKYVVCIRCNKEFCFACLNTKANCRASSEYSCYCAIPVAPRQTSIPVWNRTQVQTSNSTSDSYSIGSPSPTPPPAPRLTPSRAPMPHPAPMIRYAPIPRSAPSPTLNYITFTEQIIQIHVQDSSLNSNSNCTIL
ncbi:uncharacterized protein DDB_G0292642-like isoform X2 [Hypanus sabinus]|uniref:uncharacterized protein DDB_G0292642-like isoform X2 n=1 Tax=Hypanus sabinus TaxID=79690 RepID=UPI0028C43E3D|nr:uncharacterized protein DDB_G0292642-like isoform X2 [Hypanus sabinus]